ncbi:MAG: MaoC family dehydratase N-terminal domain-containing protein [Deltaproteobacteria bacterium]|nr:MaoC family dehydratase N-terminal domain-containing protein [Deltaproteobacteria bacterium]
MPMNRALIGKEYRGLEPCTVTADAAKAYAAATNANLTAYTGKDAIAPPMFGVAFSVKALSAPLFDPELQVDMMRLVHGDQDMRFLLPARAGDVITSTSKVLDIADKTTGELLTVAVTSKNQRGEVVLEAKSGLFVRGPRKKESLEAEKREREAEEAAWSAQGVAWTSTQQVDGDQSMRYAEASGDHNPIHKDEAMAKAAGLPGIILHGLCTMAFVHNAAVRQAGGDPNKIRRLAVRFNRPVLMGDTLTIEARGDAKGPWLVRVTNQAGVLVLKSGVVELA